MRRGKDAVVPSVIAPGSMEEAGEYANVADGSSVAVLILFAQDVVVISCCRHIWMMPDWSAAS